MCFYAYNGSYVIFTVFYMYHNYVLILFYGPQTSVSYIGYQMLQITAPACVTNIYIFFFRIKRFLQTSWHVFIIQYYRICGPYVK